MIPTFLSVRNFMCYREPVEIDFRGIRIACLSGDNGAGKSALLDCITWALWGKARVNTDRDLMSAGASDMEVGFGFMLGEQEFRVTRRRTRAGNGPQTLDIQAVDGSGWRSLTDASIRETQQRIDRLLRMDYDTFINSAFILQGRADEFTTKTPAARKQVLGEILNLGDYDRYEEIARQQFRGRERALREIDDDLADIDKHLVDLPRLQDDVAALRQELLGLADRADGLREQLAAVQAQVQALEFTASRREMLRGNLGTLGQTVPEHERQRRELLTRIEGYRATLEQRAEIEARYAAWRTLRERFDALSQRLAERQELTERRAEIERRIQRAVHKVESEIHSVACQIQERDTAIAAKPDLLVQLEQRATEIAALAGLEEEIRQVREMQTCGETRRGELQAENRRLKEDMQEIRARLDQVEAAGALCPVCRRELGADERERLQATYQAEGTQLGDRYRANGDEIKCIHAEREAAATLLDELEQRRKRAHALERESATLTDRLARIAAAEEQRTTFAALLAGLRETLADGTPGAEDRKALEELDGQLALLPYDRHEHREVQKKLTALGNVEQERHALDLAQTALERDEAQATTLALQIERAREEIAGLEAEVAELSRQLEEIDVRRSQRDALQDELDSVERQRGETQERFGAAQERLNTCLALKDRREDLAEERGRVAEEKMIFDELVLAFGKRGIQAMVIENVIPELQEEANAILDKMPGNTMRIEFRTQRQTVRGEGVIETLDIVISDEAGRRPYELYSGGEAFRVNFAIRVALSTLLARRAGTRLQTLVIDEGFGTQDNRGRDGLIEAIRAIEPDFQTILVITHIPELKEMFPTRIEVVKLPEGSRVQVT